MDKGPGRDASRGHSRFSPSLCGTSSRPHLTHAVSTWNPGQPSSSSRKPGLPLGCEGPPLGLLLFQSGHTVLSSSVCSSLCLPISLGAPEDRSSLTHPCVSTASDSGPFHHCPEATSYPQGGCCWGMAGAGRPTARELAESPAASTICPWSHRTEQAQGSTVSSSAQPGRPGTRKATAPVPRPAAAWGQTRLRILHRAQSDSMPEPWFSFWKAR